MKVSISQDPPDGDLFGSITILVETYKKLNVTNKKTERNLSKGIEKLSELLLKDIDSCEIELSRMNLLKSWESND